ncbi:hypothetical protein GJ689_18525 [Rhodoplanes serenus]|jgi:hypothetical protein|uniref:Uncharacterized protein n=1 Tax=Rhodoplanes serenus TaxID=200615 RepID=A0A327K566_9BRAD|nr:hypothetical protein [Rhodoplanes serenus]MBI5114737.1 hypothetical protein [Rhodovulum sp.]MTW18199.1 hypothetical protein [Rhodoplanes serenus]RAI32512.1 hypothetical protein CH340_15255 [Rhodoplanes serenus]VCU11485.1 hypothetical protein RHODGE_RHODGE_04965 [Rhodoplanes serenus]
MIRFVFRFLGLWILAAAFIFLVYDGTRSIAADRLEIFSFEAIWTAIHQPSLDEVRRLVERHFPPWATDPAMRQVLVAPAWLVLGVVGMVLVLLGRKKKPLIGYARR